MAHGRPGIHKPDTWSSSGRASSVSSSLTQPTGSDPGAARRAWRTAALLHIAFSGQKWGDLSNLLFTAVLTKAVWEACLLSLWKSIRKMFTWHSLSQFPLLLFVCAAQRATLPWHLSAFFIGSFIMWPFPTLWVCRYNFPLYQWFYGWLWSLLHPEGLFPLQSDCGPVSDGGYLRRNWTGWKVGRWFNLLKCHIRPAEARTA